MRIHLPALFMVALFSAAAIAAQASAPGEGEPLARARFIAEMEAQFRKTDTDRNGQLSPGEIEQLQREEALALEKQRNQQLFARLDTNRNGQISRSEFEKLISPPPAVGAQQTISRMDQDRNGSISMAEHRTATLANFDRLDSNRDGNVTAEEMKAGGLSPR